MRFYVYVHWHPDWGEISPHSYGVEKFYIRQYNMTYLVKLLAAY